MILPFTVVVQHFANDVVDTHGNPSRAQTGADTYPAMLSLRSTVESDGQTRVLDSWELILPPGAVITAGDEFTEGGRRFTVEGSPDRMRNSLGESHVEIVARYVGGVV